MPNYGHLSLSCAKIERPSPLEKPSCKVRLFVQNRSRKYRPKVTVTTLFQTAFHPDFQPLSQTAHVRSHSRKRVHTRLSEKDRTQRLTRRNRGLPFCDHSAALCCQRNPFYSTVLLYTYISRFSVAPHYRQKRKSQRRCHRNSVPNHSSLRFSTSLTNGPRSLSQAKVGTHSPSPTGPHTTAHTSKQGRFGRGAIITLGLFRTFANLPGSGIRTAYVAAFGSWSGALPKNAESLRSSDALMRVAVPKASRPRWAA